VTTPPYGHDPYSVPPTSGQPYGQSYGQPNEQPYAQPYAQPYGQPYGQPPVSGAPASGAPYPYPSGYAVPTAYSDKSKLAAGLLQLLPAFFLGLGGIGRVYAGNVSLGVTQIVLSVVGWVCFWCTFVFVLPIFVFLGLWVWFVVDGIVMLAGQPVDAQGRPLRP